MSEIIRLPPRVKRLEEDDRSTESPKEETPTSRDILFVLCGCVVSAIISAYLVYLGYQGISLLLPEIQEWETVLELMMKKRSGAS